MQDLFIPSFPKIWIVLKTVDEKYSRVEFYCRDLGLRKSEKIGLKEIDSFPDA